MSELAINLDEFFMEDFSAQERIDLSERLCCLVQDSRLGNFSCSVAFPAREQLELRLLYYVCIYTELEAQRGVDSLIQGFLDSSQILEDLLNLFVPLCHRIG